MCKISGKIEMPLQLPTERHSMIGRLWETAFSEVMQLEYELREQGTAPSIDDIRRKAGKCLHIFMQGMRGTFKVVAYYEGETQLARKELHLTVFPTPLMILLLELTELQHNRPSRLLSHHQSHGSGDNPYNLTRRFIKAKAVASAVVLNETGLTIREATKRVAATLNDANFTKPRGEKDVTKYSAATINDWRKRMRNKKGDFAQMVTQERQDLENCVEIHRQLKSDDDEIHADILAHLSAFILAVSYRDK